jgi:hypothetical protein
MKLPGVVTSHLQKNHLPSPLYCKNYVACFRSNHFPPIATKICPRKHSSRLRFNFTRFCTYWDGNTVFILYVKNGWQKTTKKNLNYKPDVRRNIGRALTRWKMISGRKEQAKWPKPYSWWYIVFYCIVWVVNAAQSTGIFWDPLCSPKFGY